MNQINLVPIAYKKRYRRKWYIIFGALGSGAACMVLITLALIPVIKIAAAEKEEIALTEALATEEMVETKMVLDETTEALGRKTEAAALLALLDVPSHITRQTMDIVVGSVPKGLRMNEVVMEKNEQSIIIDGHARSITTVAQYIVQLYNTGQFEIVEYTANPNKDSKVPGWIDYNIRIKPKNLLAKEEAQAATEEVGTDETGSGELGSEEVSPEESGGEDIL